MTAHIIQIKKQSNKNDKSTEREDIKMNKTEAKAAKATLERILKNQQKQQYRDFTKKCAVTDGKQYVLDGVIAFALNKPVELSETFTFDNNDKREKENAEILVPNLRHP